jgi:hypothetical protein
LRSVDLEYLQGVRRSGKRYCFADANLIEGKSYQYKAVSVVNNNVAGQDSNKARREYLPPSAAPELKVVSSPSGVLLEWTTPSPSKYGASAGFNLYRSRIGGSVSLVPLNNKPLKENRFEDLTLDPGARYQYLVRTIIKVGAGVVESVPSNEVTGELAGPD